MQTIRIIFPHQLFADPSVRSDESQVVLVEEHLFFRQFRFHRRKLAFHRATMRYYADLLVRKGYSVRYVESPDSLSDIRSLIPELARAGVRCIRIQDPVDDWLLRRTESVCHSSGITLEQEQSRLFINTEDELQDFFGAGRRYFQTDFYIHQRKTRRILTEDEGKPVHGKWSFDAENRQRFPKGRKPPVFKSATRLKWHIEAEQWVALHFTDNPGSLSGDWEYPVTHDQARDWLEDFLAHRFSGFGDFEDALVPGESVLHHSVLTPMLNVGLLESGQVIARSLEFAAEHGIPINDLEGFVRQILGWREFVRVVYVREGRMQRTRNYWEFSRSMPDAFYSGKTGIVPVDTAIAGVLRNGYNHHIERLMVLGNFMLLCEIQPDDVYRWFMEMYMDAYDWVMVPNVYGMSQFADGGLMCTKPYISGSNYILKMSQFKPDPAWTEIWDALFWRFMDRHRDFFGQNPRLGMLLRTLDKMEPTRRQKLITTAEVFLSKL